MPWAGGNILQGLQPCRLSAVRDSSGGSEQSTGVQVAQMEGEAEWRCPGERDGVEWEELGHGGWSRAQGARHTAGQAWERGQAPRVSQSMTSGLSSKPPPSAPRGESIAPATEGGVSSGETRAGTSGHCQLAPSQHPLAPGSAQELGPGRGWDPYSAHPPPTCACRVGLIAASQ